MRSSDPSPLMQSLRNYLSNWRNRVEQREESHRHRRAKQSPQSSSAFQLEPLESRILLAADLTGVIQSAVLPNPGLEGTTGSAVVTASNIGNLTTNRVDVAVYISQDAKFDGSDIQIGTASSGGGINAGKSKDFIVPFAISTQLDPGTYRLLAKVDSTDLTVENSETNNVAVGGIGSTITVAWQFGNVPGKPGQTALSLRDADGTLATFSLTGPGTGTITKNGSLWDIQLDGTDATTTVTITTNTGGNGRLTLNDIHVAGALGSFTAPTTDLLGALTVNNGDLPVVNAGTIAGGVISANAAPVAAADTASATENGLDVVIDVLANDTDANAGDTKTIVGVNVQGLQGTVAIAEDGQTLSYSVGNAFNSLKAGATATDTFTYTMLDSQGAQSSASVTVTITGTNDGPLAVADTASVGEHQSTLINVLANDTDPDIGDTLRVLSIDRTGTTGATAFATSGGVPMIFYTPTVALAAGQTATDHFSYTVVDSTGAQSVETVTVTITGVNDAPVALNDAVTLSEDATAQTLNVLLNDTDSDPGDSQTITAADGNGRPSQIVITSHPSQEVTTFTVIPAVAPIQGTVSIAPGGHGLVYTPSQAFQSLRAGQTVTETIFYTMTDAAGLPSSATVLVTITGANDKPMAVADQIAVDKNAGPVSINVLANDTDPDAGDTKTVVALDTTGLLGTAAIAADGSITYTVGNAFQNLQVNQTATETFSYTMQDAAGAQSTETVTVLISANNQAPAAVADQATVAEDGAALLINVLANDTDPDTGDTKKVLSIDAQGLQGLVSVAPNGVGVLYSVGQAFQQLRAGETATETFSYTMADAAGVQSTATVTVTVTGVNDAPTAVADSASAAEDESSILISVLGNDLDKDLGDTRQVVSVNTAGSKGLVAISQDGQSVIYTPFQSLRAGQTGTDQFTYTMRDSAGGLSTATVTVTVTGANDGPAAVADNLVVGEDAAAVSLSVLANDTDPDIGDTKQIVSVDSTGVQGSVVWNPGSSLITYSPGQVFQQLLTGQSATETFTYTMQDAAGVKSTATVTVRVLGVTDGVKAVDDTAVAQEDGGPITIDVLANDTNDLAPAAGSTLRAVDGAGQPFILITNDPSQEVTIVLFFQPFFPEARGTVSIAPDGRSALYTPPQDLKAGETLTDLFRYTVAGSDGSTSTGVVSVTVVGANDGPTAVNDIASVGAGNGPTTIDVLANDTDPDTGDTKSVQSVDTNGLLGTVTIAQDGKSVAYNAGAAFQNLAFGETTTETFSYTMADGSGGTSVASVTVTITGTNQAPIAVADSGTAMENGAPITINVLGNDNDPNAVAGDSVTLLSVNGTGLQGSVSLAGDGASIVYTVGNAFQGLREGQTVTETFTYTVRDNQGAQATGTVTVTIVGTNDGPLAVNDVRTVSRLTSPLTINVLANDTDIDVGDSKTVIALNTANLQGTATISADGSSVIYTAAPSFKFLESGVVTETFTYTMVDSNGAISVAQVTVNVLGAPEPGATLGTVNADIITAGNANDTVYGLGGNDSITSGAGDDIVFGGAGRDTINGGDGNDIIIGGADRDDLSGGLGADTFLFTLATDSTVLAMDKIRDFSVAQGDKIDLGLIDANTVVAGNNTFVISAGFTGVAGQLVLTQGATGYIVAGDVNGDGVADFQVDIRTNDVLNQNNFLL